MKLRALIIDDDENLLFLANKFLKNYYENLEIVPIDNSQDAIKMLGKESYDAVICDYNLGPDQMNGLEILEWFRKEDVSTPFIVFTGHSREEIAIKALNLGADYYLEKGDDLEGRFTEIGHHLVRRVEVRRTEAALQESQETLRKLSRTVELSPSAVIITNTDGVIEYVNPKFTEMTQYTPEEVIGRNPSILQSGQTPPDIYETLWNFISNGKEWHGEFINLKKNGEIYIEDAWVSPIKDPAGKTTHYVGVKQDITEKKKAAKELEDQTHQLGERVKELTAIFRTSQLLESSLLIEDLFQELGDIIQPAWQYPEITCVRTTYQSKKYETANFKETQWAQSADILVSGEVRGCIEVAYLEERPEIVDGPFLKEEQDLLDTLALMIGNYILRRTAEEAIKASEARFRAMFENASVGITIVGADDHIIEANDVYQKMLGYTIQELRQMTIADFTYPDDAEIDAALFEEVQEGKRDRYQMVKRYLRKNGQTIWVNLNVSFIVDDNQNIVSIIGIVEDISEKIRTEEALVEIEAEFRNIFESSPLGMFIYQLKPDGRLVLKDVNPAASVIMGTNLNELIGLTLEEAFPPLKDTEVPERYREVASKGTPWHSQEIAYSHGRLSGIYEVNAFQTAPNMMVASFVDITAKKRMLEGLLLTQYSIDNAPNPMLWLDIDANIIFTNDAACEFLGYSSKEMMGLNTKNFYPEFGGDRWLRFLDNIKEKESDTITLTLLRKDGTSPIVDATVSHFVFEDREMLFVYLQDITERREAEISLIETKSRYETLFEESPISLWEEDFAEVKNYLEEIKLSGVQDIRSYLTENPEALQKCIQLVKILDVNKATLYLHKTDTKDEIYKGIGGFLSDETRHGFIEEFVAIAEGKAHFIGSGTKVIVSGEEKYLRMKWSVPSKYRNTYEKVIVSVLDISESKKVERELQESEERYRLLYNRLADGLVLVDTSGTITMCSEQAAKIVRSTPEKVVGTNFQKYVHPSEQEKMLMIFKRGFETKTLSEEGYDVKGIRTDGSEFYFHIVNTLLSEGENPIGVQSLISDITERKKREDAILQTQQNLATLVENIPVVAWTTNEKGETVYVSPNIEHIFGYTPEEIYRDGSNAWVSKTHPDDLKMVQEAFREGFERGIPTNIEYRLLRKDGEWIWIHDWSTRTYVKDGERFTSGVFEDITERKRLAQEAQYVSERAARYLDIVGAIILTLNQEGIVTMINRKGCEILGYDMDEIVGKNWFDNFIPRRSLEDVLEVNTKAFSGRVSEIEVNENPIFTRSGEERMIAWRNVIIPGAANDDAIALSSGIDITDREISRKELEIQKEELGELAHIMSHDLGNKMQNIRGLVSLLNQDYDEEVLQRIDSLAKQTFRLVKSWATLADAGQIIQKIQQVDLNIILSDRASTIVPDNIVFTQDCLPTVSGSPEKIGQIIENLLVNAIEHGKPEKIEVKVKETTDLIEISFSNDGTSIPNEIHDKIFEKEYTTTGSGRGYGLAIVRKIVEAHGWTIDILDTEKTTFKITIPKRFVK